MYIVPYDFTSVGECALKCALKLGEKVHTEIQLLHLAENREKGLVKKKKLQEVAQNIQTPNGVEVTALTKIGSIFSDIGRIAKEEKAQLIIMGTHGKSGMQHLMGSHAMKVITSAECPFMVVQKDTEIADIKKILVAIDDTKESMQIANIAGDLAHIFGGEIIITAEAQTDPILKTRILNRTSLLHKQYEERDVKSKIELLPKSGNYSRKIVDYCEQHKIDLIAIAYHSESLLPQFDSFAQSLITNRLGLPVMIVNSKLASSLYF